MAHNFFSFQFLFSVCFRLEDFSVSMVHMENVQRIPIFLSGMWNGSRQNVCIWLFAISFSLSNENSSLSVQFFLPFFFSVDLMGFWQFSCSTNIVLNLMNSEYFPLSLSLSSCVTLFGPCSQTFSSLSIIHNLILFFALNHIMTENSSIIPTEKTKKEKWKTKYILLFIKMRTGFIVSTQRTWIHHFRSLLLSFFSSFFRQQHFLFRYFQY